METFNKNPVAGKRNSSGVPDPPRGESEQAVQGFRPEPTPEWQFAEWVAVMQTIIDLEKFIEH